jgi:hypothetical protein
MRRLPVIIALQTFFSKFYYLKRTTMKGLDNPTYLVALIAFNILALVMLWAAFKKSRLSRLLFFILFAWASWANWSLAVTRPQEYLNYADLTFMPAYRQFILGWFSRHITVVVAGIATCQALIALSMLMKGTLLKIGGIGAIVFLLAIVPFGVGSGFPCTLIMAIAMFVILRKPTHEFLWEGHQVEHRQVSLK